MLLSLWSTFLILASFWSGSLRLCPTFGHWWSGRTGWRPPTSTRRGTGGLTRCSTWPASRRFPSPSGMNSRWQPRSGPTRPPASSNTTTVSCGWPRPRHAEIFLLIPFNKISKKGHTQLVIDYFHSTYPVGIWKDIYGYRSTSWVRCCKQPRLMTSRGARGCGRVSASAPGCRWGWSAMTACCRCCLVTTCTPPTQSTPGHPGTGQSPALHYTDKEQYSTLDEGLKQCFNVVNINALVFKCIFFTQLLGKEDNTAQTPSHTRGQSGSQQESQQAGVQLAVWLRAPGELWVTAWSHTAQAPHKLSGKQYNQSWIKELWDQC